MFKIKKTSYFKYFVLSFVFVFMWNMLLNQDFSFFLWVMYGNINSEIAMDGWMFLKMFALLFGETWIISALFYYITKIIF